MRRENYDTIYYVVNSYFNERDKERFGIDYFLSKEIKVVIIDVQDYTNPELKFMDFPFYKEEDNLFVIKCNTFNNIKNTIKSHGNGIAILFLDDTIKSTKIRRYLKLKNIIIGIVHGGMLPAIRNNTQVKKKIIDKFKKLGLLKFLSLVTSRIYTKFRSPKKYDFLITSNSDKSFENYSIKKPHAIIETHSLDYDLVLKHKNKARLIEGKYVVFLDQYLLSHTDFIRSNTKLNISEESYYKELNELFLYIETKYHLEVVIAAHPRAKIQEYDILFNKRKIIQNNSCLLVKYCEFTITHYSTAINFAVLYNKPILFITNNCILKTSINNYINLFSSLLNQNILNLSKIESLELELEIDEKAYEKYKKEYIKCNDLELLSWDIFFKQYLRGHNART